MIRMGEPRSKVKVEMKINPVHPSTDGQTIESTWLHVTRVGGTGSWKVVGSDVEPTDRNGHGVGDFICTTCDLDFLPPGESWEQPELFG